MLKEALPVVQPRYPSTKPTRMPEPGIISYSRCMTGQTPRTLDRALIALDHPVCASFQLPCCAFGNAVKACGLHTLEELLEIEELKAVKGMGNWRTT